MRFPAPPVIALLFSASLAASLTPGTASAQTLYRWVDKDGRVHYSQQKPPPSEAKSVEQRRLGPAPASPATGGGGGQIPFAIQQAMSNYPVILYTSPSCKTGCPEARALLQKRGVPFREVSVFEPATNDFLKKVAGEALVPTLTVGSQVLKGFEEGAFNQALDLAGYPKSSLFTGALPQPPEPAGLPKPQSADTPASEGAPPGSAPQAAAPPESGTEAAPR